MKVILKIIKWIGKFIGGILLLLILLGLGYRLFNSKPVPPGKLVDVNGTELHIRAEGKINNLPTIILESGANGHTDMLHWIAEGLKKNMRVVRYDREGKWFSEPSKDSITPEFYAHQLHELLEKNGEKPPYILAGHSMGGVYTRIFRDLYPNEVIGMVFLDSSHPEQWKRLEQKELIPNSQINFLKVIAVISDLGLRGIYNKIVSPKPRNDGLPQECHIRNFNLVSSSGKVYRRNLKENSINDDILKRAGQASDLDSLPVLVFTATEQYRESQKEKYRNQGIDPDKQIQLWFEMQKELKELSTNGKQFIIEGSHGTIITKKENAEIINKEILLMAEKIEKDNK
ncbi:Protein containing alpha/beta hydrolase fold [Tenacibaculum dicentrarchi]|uniref:AB hydrolase-1 domain-containing protein n=1 Tax=Tenacibaculum dicentrarchi TaxID=669041 RepID=A0ABP1EK13_9FLAO|nr:alpha/beta hydrolase [Tenacibaculum piscium]SOS52774.1 Protein containing alpha/beta hydrolase fold [Tenacibaculum dicentrarchi]